MKFLNTLLAVMLLASCHSIAEAQWPDTTGTGNGRWWGEANGKIFDRPGHDLGLPLITRDITNDVLFTSTDLTDLGTSAGAEIRFGSHSQLLGIDWDLGAQFGSWDQGFEFAGPNLLSPFIDTDLDPDTVNVGYQSEFQTIELNWRKPFIPGMTFTTGPKYFRLSEELDLGLAQQFATPTGPFNFQANNEIATRNSAIGWQIGLEYNQPVTRDIYLQGFIKAAGLINATRVTRTDTSNIAALPVVEVREKDTGMFIGTAGGRAYFAIIPNHAHLYGGYEATWVDGVALAPPQQLNQGFESVPTANTLFWHALTFGLRYTY